MGAQNAAEVTVVGAGPAGLCAAIAARQAGYTCAIHEQAGSFARVGGAIGIQSNGLRVLEALGLLEDFREHIVLAYSATVESPPGRVVSGGDFREASFPMPGFAVSLRADLHELLARRAQELGVRIRFGSRCMDARPLPTGTSLRFHDGTSAEGRLVLACDGANSQVRDSLGFRVRKRIVGEAYLRIIAPIAHPEPERIGEQWAADGRRAGAFPLPDNRTYVFCSVPLGGWQQILGGELDRWVRTWDDFGDPIKTLMHSVRDWSEAVYDELSDVRVDRWQSRGVFLVGDAAHAMTPNLGQGANSALVDALVLVNLLASAGPDPDYDAIGRRYERVRRPFVTRVQNAALMAGQLASWTSPIARSLRDFAFRAGMKYGPMRRSAMRLMAGYNPAETAFIRRPSAGSLVDHAIAQS